LDFDNLAPSGELSCKLEALTSMLEDRTGQDKQRLSPTLFFWVIVYGLEPKTVF